MTPVPSPALGAKRAGNRSKGRRGPAGGAKPGAMGSRRAGPAAHRLRRAHESSSMAAPDARGQANVYLYGMIVLSTVHRLSGEYPEADGYGEIEETHVVPGGETGNAALLLSRWGHRVKVGGPFLGRETRDGVLGFLGPRGVDCSNLRYDGSFEGVRDVVMVGGKSRTVFGRFGRYFRGPKRWAGPGPADVAGADFVGIDPFFGAESEEAGRLCCELGRPYVTIDCAPDSALNRGAAATVVSNEFLRGHFPSAAREEMLRWYARQGAGLAILTLGPEEILFVRGGGGIQSMKPFNVPVKSTLGAGDAFRGGVIHGLSRGFSDESIVRFAAATAACVCRRFPMAHEPPGLDEIEALATANGSFPLAAAHRAAGIFLTPGVKPG
jgi:sugar/nucleoside kinase (ribokinase family)